MFEWFFQWFDRFAHKFVMSALIGHAQWVDWFALIFIVLGVLYGLQNGLLAEVAEILQIMLVIFLVFEFYGNLRLFFLSHVPQIPREMTAGLAYIVMGMTVWIAAALITKFLRKFFHIKLIQPLRGIGGALLGGAHLFIIFSFLCQVVLLLPVQQPKRAFEKGMSYSGYTTAKLAPGIHGMIAEPMRIFK